MTREEYDEWRPRSLESYAEDLARTTSRPLEAARVRAQTVFEEELADGLETPGTWLSTILDRDGNVVGELWIGPHPSRKDAAFVFDLGIRDEVRRRGYGRAAVLAAEELVAKAGVTELGLSVFGFNEQAKALYDALGYRVLATQMSKSLSN